MSAIRKDGVPVFVDGEQSKILRRDQRADAEEGWSITSRPYRNRPEDALLDNLGSTNESCCCLLPGNRVAMTAGTAKPIETVGAGDVVMTMTGPAMVTAVKTTLLGMTRKVIELRGVGDETLVMTDEHPLWVSRKAASGERRESWGTYNLHHMMYETRGNGDAQLHDVLVPLWFDLPEQVAHVSGWLHVRPIFHHLPPETEVFHLVTEGATSYIVEGFPVFSHSLQEQGKEGPWTGLSRDGRADSFVQAVTATTIA